MARAHAFGTQLRISICFIGSFLFSHVGSRLFYRLLAVHSIISSRSTICSRSFPTPNHFTVDQPLSCCGSPKWPPSPHHPPVRAAVALYMLELVCELSALSACCSWHSISFHIKSKKVQQVRWPHIPTLDFCRQEIPP